MTHPFKKNTQDNASAPSKPAVASGYNPFVGSNEQEERLPLMQAGVTARGKVIGYRITPKTPTSGTYVYVDLELTEVPVGEDMLHKVGSKMTHRLGGFESSGQAAAQRSLKELNLAICPELRTAESVDFDTLPFDLQESEAILGREIWIQTSGHTTKNVGKDGKPVVIVKGQYQPVA